MAQANSCVFCNESTNNDNPVVTLREKGSRTINVVSNQRSDPIQTVPGQVVHQECRRVYCNPIKVAQSIRDTHRPGPSVSLRSAEEAFNFKADCLFCGTKVNFDNRKQQGDVHSITLTESKDSLLQKCSTRNDAWADTVRARLLIVCDLPAADAVYHQVCSSNFRTGKPIPLNFVHNETVQKKQKLGRRYKSPHEGGRPALDDRCQAFIKVTEFLEENDDERNTISDLVDKMAEYLADSNAESYSQRYMKDRLIEHFGDRVIVTTVNGKSNVATMRQTAESVLLEFHANQSKDPMIQKKIILEAAAKFILDDIKQVETGHETYPSSEDFEFEEASLNFLPDTLKIFLGKILKAKDVELKIASIGQAIMQAARPRVLIAPLQIALGVQLQHHFASRFLIDSLHAHGYCSSYKEVTRFNQNAAVYQGTDIPNHKGEFVQYAADNVDHNIRTLDGHNTFHGMGIIAMITPGTTQGHPIPRAQVTASDIETTGRIQIQYHRADNQALATLTYGSVPIMRAHDPTANLDVLWKTSLLFKIPRPAWSGMMQVLHRGVQHSKSSVLFLPMIDLSSSDTTCIYSTLNYIAQHAKQHDVPTIITFDQPLWWKALSIILSEPDGSPMRRIVVRLGAFHMEMSFLGSIGHLMGGSGLKELLELIYAPNAVDHILTGKAVSRAVRAHILLDAVLNALLVSDPLGGTQYRTAEDLPVRDEDAMSGLADDDVIHPDVSKARTLYDALMKGTRSSNDVASDPILDKISKVFQTQTESLTKDRTAKLWLQYMDMVKILRKFIKAERMGNWSLHLEAASDMLPYLAASGHSLYAKSARIYLQIMRSLEQDYPDVHRKFTQGFHVARRSSRAWAGISSDLMIEQVLMRSMKTSGGLTRGRGMTEQQRLTWLLSMPACSETNRAMQELTGVKYSTGEQNKEMGKTRQHRDMQDTSTLQVALVDRNPFKCHPSFRNIMTGVNAGSKVDVDNAKLIGDKIMHSMTNQSVVHYTFKRKDQATTFLKARSSVRVGEDQVQIDPELLFQRLIIISKSAEDKEEMFRFELCTHPPALFDEKLMLREAQKSVLGDAIWSKLEPGTIESISEIQYVLDGGSLLHRIPWPRGSPTYREICMLYCDYVTRKYGKAIVIFDGYLGQSTKHMTHQRRAAGRGGPEVTFTDDMKLTMKKDIFLGNLNNKQNFINMLSRYLQLSGCQTHHSQEDADLLIVQTAVSSANMRNTALIGEDTDLIVLLCFYTNLEAHDLFMYSQAKSTTKPNRIWNVKSMKRQLGAAVCESILFIHAVLGCDTTSRLYGLGKGASLNKFMMSTLFQTQSQQFLAEDASPDVVEAAGEIALVCLYKGKPDESLDSLRYKRFCEKVAVKTSKILPQTLPPTSAAARYHSRRVYLQIQQWKGNNNLQPVDWGWRMSDGNLVPVMTDLPPAPQDLLNVIQCNCSTDCGSARCTCRKNNLECSPACGQCRGSSCTNSVLDSFSDDDDEENDD